MTPNEKSKPANLKEAEKFLNFGFAYAFLGMLFLFCGCLGIWLVTMMFQNVMSDDEPVVETVERTLPACDDSRVEALQVAVATCISTSTSDMEASCIETAQRAICTKPEPMVIEASVSDRDRRSTEVLLQKRDEYILELTRRDYSASQISSQLDWYDEMYGSIPFFTPAKR